MKKNNLGTPINTLTIRGKWTKIFANSISLISQDKQIKLNKLGNRTILRNCDPKIQHNVILDKIVSIEKVDIMEKKRKYTKVYDLTIPSTLDFG